ncbi:HIT family protein [Candidatus Wolfebacteria bacterium CG03_land_8_20_14_0_80_40_12]|uniref:HIT family protein n=1 Tax=Candidatus Wolfebacteria bacterium CG03_land_8_20_14_0_80_40_12 TaxID=1975069 RepID=A0A2M7B5I4_9BACT|nr:MAG: HIT family protein [Candidatus Wolfebacteria bacterium CG03_land_8_20_14_0_80_40_12]
MDCFFCKITQKEAPAEIIYEDNEAVAILDIHPRSPGHTMILPKVHSKNILDLPEKKVEGVFRAVKKVVGLLKKSLSPDGFTIGINHGKVSGQTIEHLHIHIMPRWYDDGGGSVHDVVDNPPKEPLEKLAAKIRNNI